MGYMKNNPNELIGGILKLAIRNKPQQISRAPLRSVHPLIQENHA